MFYAGAPASHAQKEKLFLSARAQTSVSGVRLCLDLFLQLCCYTVKCNCQQQVQTQPCCVQVSLELSFAQVLPGICFFTPPVPFKALFSRVPGTLDLMRATSPGPVCSPTALCSQMTLAVARVQAIEQVILQPPRKRRCPRIPACLDLAGDFGSKELHSRVTVQSIMET